ncbi:MAG: DUF882 domain-containing protein [Stappiaceae bacterium]
MLVLVAYFALTGAATAETRTLKVYNTHTGERAKITFKKNGKYIASGLREMNRFLRDWRRNEIIKMDPKLFDLIWEVYKESGSREHIHVVSAYRSPATNNMLRSRSKGVAKSSQHTRGKAMDYYLPDVKLSKLRAIGLRKQVGGVGYYPTSRSPFTHMDTGSVRHWPRMTRKQLVRVFPKGNTIHVPTDGKPLPGYKQALAQVNRNKGRASSPVIQVASAEKKAATKKKSVAKNQRQKEKPETEESGPGFFASLFSRDKSDETAQPETQVASAKRAPGAIISNGDTAPVPGGKDIETQVALVSAVPRLKPNSGVITVASADAVSETVSYSNADKDALDRKFEAVTLAFTPQGKPEAVQLGPVAQPASDGTLPLGSPGSQSAPAGTLPLGSPLSRSQPVVLASVTPSSSNNPIDAIVTATATATPRSRVTAMPQPSPAVLSFAAESTDLPVPQPAPSGFVILPKDAPMRPDKGVQLASLGNTPVGIEIPQEKASNLPGQLERAALKEAKRNAESQEPLPSYSGSLPALSDPFALFSTAPNVNSGEFMNGQVTTRMQAFAKFSHPDMRTVSPMLSTPQRVLKSFFSEDTHLLSTNQFRGPAIVSLPLVEVR